jgi:hypothetical protein
MPPIPPQTVEINCPNCGNRFPVQLYNVVDVSQQPELKQHLLSGQLNLAVCTNCNTATMLSTPLVYHDLEKQLCMVFIPPELNLPAEQQERLIGDTTGVLMQNLPEGAPRGHLLTPRRMMSLPSLIDTILEADGIPREVLEQQRRRVELISELASALADEQQFTSKVEQHKAELTPELFSTIDAFIQTGMQEGQDESIQVLQMLKSRLREHVGESVEAPAGQVSESDIQQAVGQIAAASDEELDEMIAELRPAIDYSFFEAWTARIEELTQQGNTAEAERLTARRAYILERVEQMDKEAQELFEASANVLREVLAADDPEAVLRDHSERLDDAFMLVLSANVASAQRAGQEDLAARLEEISRMAIEIVQENLPPEDRLINQLLMEPSAEQSSAMLRSNTAQVTPEFVKRLNEMADQQDKEGVKAAAERLRRLAREASSLLY